jgi:hypothetical protein
VRWIGFARVAYGEVIVWNEWDFAAFRIPDFAYCIWKDNWSRDLGTSRLHHMEGDMTMI